MTLLEFKELIDKFVKLHPRDAGEQEVVVFTGNPGVPSNHLSHVANAGPGFDWTARFFLLYPADSLVVENKMKKPIREVAIERLRQLISSHGSLGFRYIAKSREKEWIDGFIEGARMHFTSEEKEDDKQKLP